MITRYTVERVDIDGKTRYRVRPPDSGEGIPSTGVIGDPVEGEKFFWTQRRAQRVADTLNRMTR